MIINLQVDDIVEVVVVDKGLVVAVDIPLVDEWVGLVMDILVTKQTIIYYLLLRWVLTYSWWVLTSRWKWVLTYLRRVLT